MINKRVTQMSLLMMTIIVSGCASLGKPRPSAPITITQPPAYDHQYSEVIGNHNAIGNKVRWGGEIIKVTTQDDGNRRITLIEQPIQENGKPDYRHYRTNRKRGRFIIELNESHSNKRLRRNSFVVIYGELSGFDQIKPKNQQHIPVIKTLDLHVWRSHYRPNCFHHASCNDHFYRSYYPYYPRYYYHPFFYH